MRPARRLIDLAEGRYQKALDQLTRLRAMAADLKAAEKLKKDIQNLDKPDRKKRRMNLR